jgi:two-component system alkaline phosphatase synthesis response regulator PhoP/two-component system response regulator RpaA
MEPARILVIEDDPYVARTIERCLHGDQFSVTLAENGAEGLRLARQHRPDLIILDVIMPGMDGYTVCRTLRAQPDLQEVPVLFLTARIKPEDKIAGFKSGADDYLCKPFNLDELLLRVQAILRRTLDPITMSPKLLLPAPGSGKLAQPQHCLVLGKYVLDTRTFEIQTPTRGKVRLTPRQYDFIYHLMTHPGEVFTPARLLKEVWNYPRGRGSPDLVRVQVKALRDRIEDDPASPVFLRTVPGKGYMVNQDQL